MRLQAIDERLCFSAAHIVVECLIWMRGLRVRIVLCKVLSASDDKLCFAVPTVRHSGNQFITYDLSQPFLWHCHIFARRVTLSCHGRVEENDSKDIVFVPFNRCACDYCAVRVSDKQHLLLLDADQIVERAPDHCDVLEMVRWRIVPHSDTW